MTGSVGIVFIEPTDRLRVPFLARSGAPTGVYYSITQCRSVGLRPTSRPTCGVGVFDSLPRENFTSQIQRSSSARTTRAIVSPTTRFVFDQAGRVESCRAEKPVVRPSGLTSVRLDYRAPSDQHHPENAHPGPQRASL